MATDADIGAIVDLTNVAYLVEAFFKIGPRIDAEEVRTLMAGGEFLLVEEKDRVVASVYMAVDGTDGYLGLLSVDPEHQRRGLGRVLTEDVERRCRDAGCSVLTIHVVSLRTELPGYYRRLGFTETGETLPFPDDERTTRPCHMIVMSKPLGRSAGPANTADATTGR